MRTKDTILLEEAYDKLQALKDFVKGVDFELKSKFFDIICYEAENFAASILDQDSASSDEISDWLYDLKTNPQEIESFTISTLDHIRDDFQTEGEQWTPEIEQQFLDFFHKVLQSGHSKVWDAISRRDDYTNEIELLLSV
jgi:hypothetical protein